jgi:hypothetical protein
MYLYFTGFKKNIQPYAILRKVIQKLYSHLNKYYKHIKLSTDFYSAKN